MSSRSAATTRTARAGGGMSSRSGACVLSLNGTVTWVSAGAYPLFGGKAQLIGARFETLWQEEDRVAAQFVLSSAMLNGEGRFVGRPMFEPGEGFDVDAVLELRRDGFGMAAEIVASLREVAPDVGDYEALFDAVPLVMWTTRDANASAIVGNRHAAVRYGMAAAANHSLSPKDGRPHDHYRYFIEGQEVPAAQLPMQRAAKGEHVTNEEFEVRLAGGSSHFVILNASPILDVRGKAVGAVGAELDITERKRIEETQRRLLECSRVTGRQFFSALVKALSESLGARGAYVAEVLPGRPSTVRTLAAYLDGSPTDLGDIGVCDTPCQDVIKGKPLFISTAVQRQYPDSDQMGARDIDSYIGTPLIASDGRVIGLISVFHNRPIDQTLDQTLRPDAMVEIFAGRAAAELERIHTEATLRRNEREYRIITDAMPALIAFIDNEQRYQFANAAYDHWFGLDPVGLEAHHVWDVLGQSAYEGIRPYVERALRGEHVSFEARIPYLIGGPRHVQGEYVPHVQDGRVLGYFSFVYDLTARKASEEALRKSEEQFRTLFEHLPVGAALVDHDGDIVLENEVFGRLMPTGASGQSDSIYARACTAASDDAPGADPEDHPVRRALAGSVVRETEFLCNVGDGRSAWVSMSAIPVRDHRDRVTGALVVVADIHGEKRAEARRTLLINELNHRVKNTLASVQSIASQTFRTSALAQDGLDAFEARLLALSDAHNLLTREGWEGADLKQLVALVMEPHNPGGLRLRTNGPSVRLKPPAALAFAMALHELATNAVKYGAFSVPDGNVRLSWSVANGADGRRLKLSWIERGGPVVVAPERKGFGSRLIERSLAFELGSDTSLRFVPEGVECEIDADLLEISG